MELGWPHDDFDDELTVTYQRWLPGDLIAQCLQCGNAHPCSEFVAGCRCCERVCRQR